MLLLSCIAKYNIFLNLTSLRVSELVDLILPPLYLIGNDFFLPKPNDNIKIF